MNYSLLWENEFLYNYVFDDCVFDDLGLNILFEKIFGEEYKNVTSIMKYVPASDTIQFRLDLLDDIMNPTKDDFFKGFKNNLDTLEKNFKTYETESNIILKKLNYYLLLKEYKNFVQITIDSMENLDFKSERLLEYKEYLNNHTQELMFNELTEDIFTLGDKLSNIKGMILKMNISDNRVSYKLESKLNNYQNVTIELEKLCGELGINRSNHYSYFGNKKLNDYFIDGIFSTYREEYNLLNQFHTKYSDYFNVDIFNFSRDLRYYLKLKILYQELDRYNIAYCRPVIEKEKNISLTDCTDITLITKGVNPVVTNNIKIEKEQPINIVTGVNSGGKTSYLRALGISQLLFLAGAYVPATSAKLYPLKNLITHFPTKEDYKVGKGRLADEQERINEKNQYINSDCLLLLNETFSSTYQQKSLECSQSLLLNLIEKDVFCVYITHQHKLIDFIKQHKREIGLLTPQVDHSQKNKRLYKIMKVYHNVYSYTQDILYKFGLTQSQLDERLEGLK